MLEALVKGHVSPLDCGDTGSAFPFNVFIKQTFITEACVNVARPVTFQNTEGGAAMAIPLRNRSLQDWTVQGVV